MWSGEALTAKRQERTSWGHGNVLYLGYGDGFTIVYIAKSHETEYWKWVIFILSKLYLIKAGLGEGKAKHGTWHQVNILGELLILFLYSCHLEF